MSLTSCVPKGRFSGTCSLSSTQVPLHPLISDACHTTRPGCDVSTTHPAGCQVETTVTEDGRVSVMRTSPRLPTHCLLPSRSRHSRSPAKGFPDPKPCWRADRPHRPLPAPRHAPGYCPRRPGTQQPKAGCSSQVEREAAGLLRDNPIFQPLSIVYGRRAKLPAEEVQTRAARPVCGGAACVVGTRNESAKTVNSRATIANATVRLASTFRIRDRGVWTDIEDSLLRRK